MMRFFERFFGKPALPAPGATDQDIRDRMEMVQMFGCRWEGDTFLARGDLKGYQAWLVANQDLAPFMYQAQDGHTVFPKNGRL